MRKRLILLFGLVGIFLVVIGIFCVRNHNFNIKNNLNKQLSNTSTLSMMFETEVGSGEYKLANQNKWPSDGYIFNELLSSCENGSTLTWNEEKKTISKKGSLPDRCMIYFDKYVLPSITSYEITNTEDSISISLVTVAGTNPIKQYRYSIDNGESFIDSTSQSYTFSDLQTGSYNVHVYIEDTIGRKSTILEKQVYVLTKPTTPTLAFDSSYNILISGSTSENGAVEYYYSLDNTNFTKGNTVTVSKSSTIYAYSLDEMEQKSDVVSKAVTVSDAVNGTVTSKYYCSKTYSYQSSSTCSYSYSATATYSCSSQHYYSGGLCYSRNELEGPTSLSDCNTTCLNWTTGRTSAYCEWIRRGIYYCYFTTSGSPSPTTTYSCPNGGNLSSTTCTGATYTGSIRYVCQGKYYSSSAEATTACTNYCASGTYYNGKCYKLS